MYNNHDDKIKAKEEFKFRNFIAIRSMFIYISDGHTYIRMSVFFYLLLEGRGAGQEGSLFITRNL